jgi:hypothetical protein
VSVRKRLIQQQEHVSVGRVSAAVLQHYGVSSWADLRVTHIDKVEPLRNLKDLTRSTSSLIIAGAQTGALTTIADCLALCVEHSGVPDATAFSDLGLGPALQHPDVRRAFSLDSLSGDLMPSAVPPHHAGEFFAILGSFAPGVRASLDDFLRLVCKKFDVADARQVGLRVNSFPLCLSTMGRARKHATKVTELALEQVSEAELVRLSSAAAAATPTPVSIAQVKSWCSEMDATVGCLSKQQPKLAERKRLVAPVLACLAALTAASVGALVSVRQGVVDDLRRLFSVADDASDDAVVRAAMATFRTLDSRKDAAVKQHAPLVRRVVTVLLAACHSAIDVATAAPRDAGDRDDVDSDHVTVDHADVVDAVRVACQRRPLQTSDAVSLSMHLSAIEQSVAARFGADDFCTLGHGRSLLDFVRASGDTLRSVDLFVPLAGGARSDALPPSVDAASVELRVVAHLCVLRGASSIELADFFGDCQVPTLADGDVALPLALQLQSAIVVPFYEPTGPSASALARPINAGAAAIAIDLAQEFLVAISAAPLCVNLNESLSFGTAWRSRLPAQCSSVLCTFVHVLSTHPSMAATSVVVYADSLHYVTRLERCVDVESAISEAVSRRSADQLAHALMYGAAMSDRGNVTHLAPAVLQAFANAVAVASAVELSALAAVVLGALAILPPNARTRIAVDCLVRPVASVFPNLANVIAALATRSFPARLALHSVALSTGFAQWRLEATAPAVQVPASDGALLSSSTPAPLPVAAANLLAHVRTASTPTAAAAASHDAAAGVIHSIRAGHGEFVGADSADAHVVHQLRSRQSRAIQKLSAELYSDKTHFVLELIQNCDDNAYDDDAVPLLSIELDGGDEACVFVRCNERGFEEAHVRALCDIGASTKSSTTGFIGQKGIGFKSVFAVTDAPEVHSRAFHFRFARDTFVVPEWIAECDVAAHCVGGGANTTFRLPLTHEFRRGAKLQWLTVQLANIQPMLLLFLQQLRILRVRVPGEPLREMHRVDSPGSRVVELRLLVDGAVRSTERFFVLRRTVHPPAHLTRNDVAVPRTDVALAFRVVGQGAGTAALSVCEMFAFLPLRTFGLRFVVQADFMLTTSREELAASVWNDFLCDHVPSLYVDAFHALLESTALQDVCFFGTLPILRDIAPGPILSVARNIVSHMQRVRCVRVIGEEKSGGEEWSLPRSAVSMAALPAVDRSLVLHVWSGSGVASATSLELALLDDQWAASVGLGSQARTALGVRTIAATDVLRLIVARLDVAMDGADVCVDAELWRWLASALVCAERVGASATADARAQFYAQCANVPILLVRCADAALLSRACATGVFCDFTAASGGSGGGGGGGHKLDFDQTVLSLVVLDQRLFGGCSAADRRVLCDLLSAIGVCDLTPSSIVHRHVLPRLVSADVSGSDAVALLRVIVACSGDPVAFAAKELPGLPLRLLGDDGRCHVASELCLAAPFDAPFAAFAALLPDSVEHAALFVSPQYVTATDDAALWGRFLLALGVRRYFRANVCAGAAGQFDFECMAASPWRDERSWLHVDTPTSFIKVLSDAHSPTIVAAARAVDALCGRGRQQQVRANAAAAALWRCVSLADLPATWITASLQSPTIQFPPLVPSSLLIALRQLRWTPTLRHDCLRPGLVVQMDGAFEGAVPLLAVDAIGALRARVAALASAIGVLADASAELLVDVIVEVWAPSIDFRPPSLAALHSAMRAILRDARAVAAAKARNMHVWVARGDALAGVFEPIGRLVWVDATGGIAERLGLLRALQPTYAQMCEGDEFESRHLFRTLGVRPLPLWTQYAQALQLLAGVKQSDVVDSMSGDERRRAACEIFATVSRQFQSGEMERDDANALDNWRVVLMSTPLLPSELDWFRFGEVLLNDDEPLAARLLEHSRASGATQARWGVLTAELSRRAEALFRALGLQSVAQQARNVVTVTEPLYGIPHVELLVQRALDAAQDAVAQRLAATGDSALTDRANRFAERLSQMHVVTVHDLRVACRLAIGDNLLVAIPPTETDCAADAKALMLRGGAVRRGAHVADNVFASLAVFVATGMEQCPLDAVTLAKLMAFASSRPPLEASARALPPTWVSWSIPSRAAETGAPALPEWLAREDVPTAGPSDESAKWESRVVPDRRPSAATAAAPSSFPVVPSFGGGSITTGEPDRRASNPTTTPGHADSAAGLLLQQGIPSANRREVAVDVTDVDVAVHVADVDDALAVGRLGEEVAAKLLRARFGDGRVWWTNEHAELGLPFDIVVLEEGASPLDRRPETLVELARTAVGVAHFVEVKTATLAGGNDKPFLVSARELVFAHSTIARAKFSLHRLLLPTARHGRARLTVFECLEQAIADKQLCILLCSQTRD